MSLRWVECPRDAWQALPQPISAGAKREHLQGLLDAGFRQLDLGSFVSPRAVPQMADTEAVLAELDRPQDADFICIIANMKGLERACASGRATTIGYPLSLNETFQLRNSGLDLAHSWRLVEELDAGARSCGMEIVVYLSMAFGNPYGEPWAPADTVEAVDRLRSLGIARVALADTAGTADPGLTAEVLSGVDRPEELGLHLHARGDSWQGLVQAAFDSGVRWFEGALAGIGGCPFAQDELVGNLATEKVLPWLAGRTGESPIPLRLLPALARQAAQLASAARGQGGKRQGGTFESR